MWYAIRTEPGCEEAVRRQMESMIPSKSGSCCRILYCIRKKRYQGAWHDKKERFLPGYMFLVTEDAGHENERSGGTEESPNKLPGIISEIGGMDRTAGRPGRSGPGVWEMPAESFFPVKREEEEFLVRLTQGKDEIGMSYGVIRDGTLEIRSGVLVGMESRVRKIDRHKRKGYIAMRINGVEKLAEIGLEITEKTYAPAMSLAAGGDGQTMAERTSFGGEGMACGM